MRWMSKARIFFLLLFLTGLICAFGYPLITSKLSNAEIANIPVYNRATGFFQARLQLSPPQSPFRVFLRMKRRGNLSSGLATTKFEIHGSSEKFTEFISSVTFSAKLGVTPQINGSVYEALAGSLPVNEQGLYRFVVLKNGYEGIPVDHIDLVIRGRIIEADKRIQYLGFALAALGLAGLLFWNQIKRLVPNALSHGYKTQNADGGATILVRWMMATSALLLFASAIAGVGHSWYEGSLSGREIGRHLIFQQAHGFSPFFLNLAPDQSPINIRFDLTPLGNYQKPYSRTEIAIDVSLYDDVVLRSLASFSNVGETSGSYPVDKTFSSAIKGFSVSKGGTYTINARMSGIEGLTMQRILMIIESGPKPRNQVMQAIAYGLLALGAVTAFISQLASAGLVGSTSAAKPRWGRDVGT
jgi:hypothetical protein